MRQRLASPAQISRWIVIDFASVDPAAVHYFVGELLQAMRNLGLQDRLNARLFSFRHRYTGPQSWRSRETFNARRRFTGQKDSSLLLVELISFLGISGVGKFETSTQSKPHCCNPARPRRGTISHNQTLWGHHLGCRYSVCCMDLVSLHHWGRSLLFKSGFQRWSNNLSRNVSSRKVNQYQNNLILKWVCICSHKQLTDKLCQNKS